MNQLTLAIKFTAKPDNRDQFKQILTDLFLTIEKEPNFINATLSQGVEKPEEFFVYETWNDSIEHFIGVQMKKTYAIVFEQSLLELDIKREPAAFTPFAHYGTHRKEK